MAKYTASNILQQLKFRRGDFNGFVQLFFDNLATVLSVLFLLQDCLRGFKTPNFNDFASVYPESAKQVNDYIDEIIYGRAMPGLGITMIFGNIYYSYMGVKLGLKENRPGSVTAQPYGINTPGAFAFLFGIIGPASLSYITNPQNDCLGLPFVPDITGDQIAQCWIGGAENGWRVGVISNFLAGLISIVLGFFGNHILKCTPLVALLTSLGGIGFVFLGFKQASYSYAEPIAGLLPMFLALTAYFGNIDFGPIPKSLLVVIIGLALGWADGVRTADNLVGVGENVKAWGIHTGFTALGDWSSIGDYIGTVFPVALAAAAATLMNVISAKQAGDDYGVLESMISDGVGTCIGALFGTPFGTSIYIGHPAYKKMEAGVVYSLINCVIFAIFAFFGLFSPVESFVPYTAVAPLILYVGLTITQEAFVAAPARHYPAVAFGLFFAILDWAMVAGVDNNGESGELFVGYLAISKADLLIALVTTAILVFLIDRKFLAATAWFIVAAVLGAFGLIHQGAASADKFWAMGNGELKDLIGTPSKPLNESVDIPLDLYCWNNPIPGSVNGPHSLNPFGPGNGEWECSPTQYKCRNFIITPSAGDDFVPMCASLKTRQWRWLVGYLMCAAMSLIFYAFQYKGWIQPEISEEEIKKEMDEMIKSAYRRAILAIEKETNEENSKNLKPCNTEEDISNINNQQYDIENKKSRAVKMKKQSQSIVIETA